MTFFTVLYFWFTTSYPVEAILPKRIRIPRIMVIETPYEPFDSLKADKNFKTQHKANKSFSRKMLKK